MTTVEILCAVRMAGLEPYLVGETVQVFDTLLDGETAEHATGQLRATLAPLGLTVADVGWEPRSVWGCVIESPGDSQSDPTPPYSPTIPSPHRLRWLAVVAVVFVGVTWLGLWRADPNRGEMMTPTTIPTTKNDISASAFTPTPADPVRTAMDAQRAGNFGGAVPLWKTALASGGDPALCLENLAYCEAKCGNLDASLAASNRMLSARISVARAYYIRGIAYELAGRNTDAADAYRGALAHGEPLAAARLRTVGG